VGESAVWTGSEVIIYGGINPEAPWEGALNTGAAYDPQRDTWRSIAVPEIYPRSQHVATWIGNKMIVWGGCNEESDCQGPYRQGAVYDPVEDAWTALAVENVPVGRQGHRGVWTGTDVFYWGGMIFDSETETHYGARYNLATQSWMEVASAGEPSQRVLHTMVWTGTQAIVWGGMDESSNIDHDAQTGARWNAVTNEWLATTLSQAPRGRRSHVASYQGDLMLVWGGRAGDAYLDDGAAYDPLSDQWKTLPPAPLSARDGHGGALLEERWVIWGGANLSTKHNDGAVYRAKGDCWESLTVTGAPTPRSDAQVLATDQGVFIWGGLDVNGNAMNDGAVLRLP
jgi:N-acetylneuraminic acid mutarotase